MSSDYIHHGWCREIFAQPYFKKSAVQALKKMGVKVSPSLSSEQMCELLAKNVCKIVERGCGDSPEEIKVVCGKVTECWQPAVLLNEMRRNKKFKARFSTHQKRALDKIYKSLTLPSSNLPCYYLSGLEGRCNSQNPRCAYYYRSFWRTKKYNNECYLTQDYLVRAFEECKTSTILTVQNVVKDIIFDQLHRNLVSVDTYKISIYESYLLREETVKLQNILEEQVDNLDRNVLCKMIDDYISAHKKGDTTEWILSSLENLLVLLSAFYITPELIETILNYMGVTISSTSKRLLLLVINISLAYIEYLRIPWSLWFILFPSGRKALTYILTDPVVFAAYVLAFKITGLKDDVIFPNVERAFENLKLVPQWVPLYETLSSIDPVRTGVAIGARQLKGKFAYSTSLQKKIEKNLKKLESQILPSVKREVREEIEEDSPAQSPAEN